MNDGDGEEAANKKKEYEEGERPTERKVCQVIKDKRYIRTNLLKFKNST